MPRTLCTGAQNHVNAIYALNERLVNSCADRYDSEMDQLVRGVVDTFDGFLSASSTELVPRVSLFDDSISRSYTTAQCACLLAFAHEVDRMAKKQDDTQLIQSVNGLWERLSQTHQRFFSEKLFR